MTTADEILSAEFALGLLDGPQSARAEDRMTTDPEFARAVQDWQDMLSAAIAAPADQAAPAHVLDKVRRQLFGAPAAEPVSGGLPWGRIIGGVVAAKLVVVLGILGWNAHWISRTAVETRWGPAALSWHERQGRILLEHDGPEELLIWTEEGGALRYIGAEGGWIPAGLTTGTPLLLGPGRPGQPDGATARVILGQDD